MALFSLMAKLGLDVSEFQTGLKRAESASSGFSSKVKDHLGKAFTVGAVVQYARQTKDFAGRIMDLAESYDLTTEQVQRFQEAAARGGTELETLTQGTVRLADARARATKGDSNAIIAFERFGISMDELNDRTVTTYDLMMKVGAASASGTKSFSDQQAMVELLGAKSVRLTKAIRELVSLGPINIISDEELERVDKLGDKFDELLETTKRANVGLIASVFGAGQNLFEAYFQAANQFGIGFRNAAGTGYKNRMKTAFDYAETAIRDAFAEKKPEPTGKTEGPALPRDTKEFFGPTELGQTFSMLQRGESPRMKKDKEMERSRFDRPSTGSLASIGGLYFGADYNTRLMSTAEKQVRELEKISTNTKDAAESLKQ